MTTSEKFNFSKTEEKILEIWNYFDCFQVQNNLIKDRPQYVFHDGPPFATGLPHYGHILSGTIKDTVTRYAIQQGYSCSRRFGWDCHGLPVEYEIDKINNISTRKQVIEEIGIKNYNDMCRSIVQKYTDQWEEIVSRMARWVDFRDGYRTMDLDFMESIWYTFSRIYDLGRVYRGFRVMAYSTACSTPLSNFEANQNYKEVSDPSVVVKFVLKPESRESLVQKSKLSLENGNVSLLIWTTTPWTLPSNLGCCVCSKFEYVLVQSNSQEYFICLENRLSAYKPLKDCKVIAKVSGSDLVGLKYVPIFDLYKDKYPHLFQVLDNPNVDASAGTGIIPNSPAFGEEDYNLFISSGLLKEDEPVPCPLDEKGVFFETEFLGKYFKDADKEVIASLKSRNLLIIRQDIVHRYPFCWRSDTPLIYRLVPNWFIKLSDFQDNLVDINDKINWIPNNIKSRFSNWLAQARDWSISRNRFWGTPIPIWTDEKFETRVVIRSVKELEMRGYRLVNGEKTKVKITDIHRENIDDILIDHEGKTLSRIDEVFDCWFESGSMPYAQDHWPFVKSENKSLEEEVSLLSMEEKYKNTPPPEPADFIAEGLDQTRGWFYTLHVISTLLFNRPSYKNIICFGIVLAQDGKKMSKRLKNYPDPMEIASLYGVDALRLYLISSPVVEAENLKFKKQGVEEIFKNLMLNWKNCLNFYLNCHTDREKDTISNLLKFKPDEISKCLDVFDCWILNEYTDFAQSVKSLMKKYELNGVLAKALVFVESLSNWYIRMNRDKLRNTEQGNTDQIQSADVLYYILKQFSVIMAPFTPYFSEYSFQVMVTGGDSSIFSFSETAQQSEMRTEAKVAKFNSVHYQLYPEILPHFPDNNFSLTKKIIEGIRSLREQCGISLKTPLYDCKVLYQEGSTQSLAINQSIIMSECNLLNVSKESDTKFSFEVSVKPNFNKIKKINQDEDVKGKISLIMQLIKQMNENTSLEKLLKTEKYSTIKEEELFIEKNLKHEEKHTATTTFTYKYSQGQELGDSMTVSLILRTDTDDHLLKLKETRELNSAIQKMRKELGLNRSDRVLVFISNEVMRKNLIESYPAYEMIDEIGSRKVLKETVFNDFVVALCEIIQK